MDKRGIHCAISGPMKHCGDSLLLLIVSSFDNLVSGKDEVEVQRHTGKTMLRRAKLEFAASRQEETIQ